MNHRDRVEIAHIRAVKAAQRYEVATPGTQNKSVLYLRWQNAEQKFEKAIAALTAANREVKP